MHLSNTLWWKMMPTKKVIDPSAEAEEDSLIITSEDAYSDYKSEYAEYIMEPCMHSYYLYDVYLLTQYSQYVAVKGLKVLKQNHVRCILINN